MKTYWTVNLKNAKEHITFHYLSESTCIAVFFLKCFICILSSFSILSVSLLIFTACIQKIIFTKKQFNNYSIFSSNIFTILLFTIFKKYWTSCKLLMHDYDNIIFTLLMIYPFLHKIVCPFYYMLSSQCTQIYLWKYSFLFTDLFVYFGAHAICFYRAFYSTF